MALTSEDLDKRIASRLTANAARVNHFGDEAMLIRKVSGQQGQPDPSELDRVLFRPQRFIVDDVGNEWYPNGLPFTEVTVRISWFPVVSEPVVTIQRDRSLLHVHMPLGTGVYAGASTNERVAPNPPTSLLIRFHQNLCFLHYELGSDGIVALEEMRQILRDPRGYIHSFRPERIKEIRFDATGLDPADPLTQRKSDAATNGQVRMVTPAEEDPNALQFMSMTLQNDLRARLELNRSEQGENERNLVFPYCCNGGHGPARFIEGATPAEDEWVLDFYTLFAANWATCPAPVNP